MNWLEKSFLTCCIAALCVAGCAQHPMRDGTVPGSDGSGKAGVEQTSSPVDAWEKLVTQPGEPGIDYDPQELLVVYKPNPVPLPAGVYGVAGGDSASSVAASMPNTILRSNQQYELVTDAIASALGLTIRQQVYQGSINAASFRLDDGMDGDVVLATLRQRFEGQIEHAVYSPLHHAAYIPNDEDFITGADGRQWSHWRIGCPEAWDYELGEQSVLIGVVDTGVRLTHEELAGQVLDPQVHFAGYALDVLHNDNTVEDLDGHGTYIAGLAVATGNNERKITGVAPGCRVIPVKIADTTVAGTLDIVAGCLLAYNLGAKVVNLSFSTALELSIERDMVNQIWDGGAVLVSVAGNFGEESAEYPGAFENAICVGGTDKDDARWESSNYGTTVNLAAPGMGLKSCTNGSNDSSYYSNGAGTSYSAGIVSGALGLLFSLGPDVTNVMARQALESSGVPVAGFVGEVNRIDVGAAISEMISANGASATSLITNLDIYGTVIERSYIGMSILGAANVAKVTYTLDLAPVGVVGGNDISMGSSAGIEFPEQMFVPYDCPNQHAKVVVQCFNSWDFPGVVLEKEVLIFNFLGDTNIDGVVDALDVEPIQSRLGMTEFDPGYSIFADTNLDGVINETDLAWVGYNWDN